MDQDPLTTAFHRDFDLFEPLDAAALRAVFRLRYEVYCREFHFEREEDCPEEQEIDEYDADSWHCVLQHRSSRTAAGCVRIVPASGRGSHTELPMEKYCRGSFLDVPERPDRLDRGLVCEVSRLAVHGRFRRRRGEAATPRGDVRTRQIAAEQYRSFPMLALGLFMGATAMATLHGKEHAFAMMEPSLARILRRTGLPMAQVGRLQEYHGRRAAFYIHRETASEGIERSEFLRDLYHHAYDIFTGNMEPPADRVSRVRAA